MGQVYRALHRRLDRQVAIKRLAPQLSHNQDMIKRFLQEARLQARLPHPNVVSIFDLIENEQGVYLVMEYVEGRTAKAMLAGRERLTMTETLMIADGVLCGLDFMHRNGVVHRDIKPSNIMVAKDGMVKVTDFGIARLMDEESGLTRFGGVGTLHYMAPELIRTGSVSFSVDIYSLGATMHELLSGMPPFVGNTDLEIMMGHLEKEPLPLHRLPDDMVGQGCRELVAKALAKTPEERFPSAAAFLAEVRRVRAQLPPEAVWPVVDPVILAPEAASSSGITAATFLVAASAPHDATTWERPGGVRAAAESRDASRTSVAPLVPESAALQGKPAAMGQPGLPEDAVRSGLVPEAKRPGRGRRTIAVGIILVATLGAAGAVMLGSGEKTSSPPVEQATPVPKEEAVPASPAASGDGAPAQAMPAVATPLAGSTAQARPEAMAAAAPDVPVAAPQAVPAAAAPAAQSPAPPAGQVSLAAAAPEALPAPSVSPEAQAESEPAMVAVQAPAPSPAAAVPAAATRAAQAPAAPTTQEQKPAKPTVAYVAAMQARLRDRPDATAAVLARLEKGTRLVVLAQENDWLKVSEPAGRTGYVNAKATAASPSPSPAAAARPAKQALPRPAAKPGAEPQSGWSIVK